MFSLTVYIALALFWMLVFVSPSIQSLSHAWICHTLSHWATSSRTWIYEWHSIRLVPAWECIRNNELCLFKKKYIPSIGTRAVLVCHRTIYGYLPWPVFKHTQRVPHSAAHRVQLCSLGHLYVDNKNTIPQNSHAMLFDFSSLSRSLKHTICVCSRHLFWSRKQSNRYLCSLSHTCPVRGVHAYTMEYVSNNTQFIKYIYVKCT